MHAQHRLFYIIIKIGNLNQTMIFLDKNVVRLSILSL
jgi:hypothetical protein